MWEAKESLGITGVEALQWRVRFDPKKSKCLPEEGCVVQLQM